MIRYRALHSDEIDLELFRGFVRRQVVTKCLRKVGGVWRVRDDPFVDDWSDSDYRELVSCLRRTLRSGGFVLGAFYGGESVGGALKGFVSVEPELFGGDQRYLDLSSIHVSEEMRGRGIGSVLFSAAKDWARSHGAKKLYISAHSSVESQGFYRKMGCVEAQAYDRRHVEKEPYDCQLECWL